MTGRGCCSACGRVCGGLCWMHRSPEVTDARSGRPVCLLLLLLLQQGCAVPVWLLCSCAHLERSTAAACNLTPTIATSQRLTDRL
jgi:hypothetical protein